MSSQKEFTFPVPSSTNSHRVVRPTKVVPLGKALEKTAISNARRNNSGTTSSMSVSSMSRSSRESASKKYQLAPTHNSATSVTGSAIQRRQERRQQSAKGGGAIEPLPGGSFHASFNHHYNSRDNDDDSFRADDHDAEEWWDDNGGAPDPKASRKSTKVQKVKVKAQEFFSGSGNHKTPSHSSSSLPKRETHHAPPESSRRLDHALSKSLGKHDHHSSDDKSVQSSRSRLRSKTPLRGVSRSKSDIPNAGAVAVPKGTLFGRSAADDEDDCDGLPPSPSRVIRRSRGRSVETRSKTSLPMGSRSRSQKRSSGASVASAASAPQMTATGRVKVGRVARPGSSSSTNHAASNVGSSVTNRYGFSGSSSSRLGASSTHTHSFDPFAVSEHGHVKASELPLQVQRRGKYNDKETMLRKVKEIGISEHMLQDMKQAGLVITEGKR